MRFKKLSRFVVCIETLLSINMISLQHGEIWWIKRENLGVILSPNSLAQRRREDEKQRKGKTKRILRGEEERN